MEVAEVVERVHRLADVDDTASASELQEALVAARELSGWVEARRAGVVRCLSSTASFPEQAIADADRSSLTQAARTTERAVTLEHTPLLADRLGDGAITAGHVDAVTRCAKTLDVARRADLFDRVDRLADVAGAATVDEFARRVRLEAHRLRADDGEDRLARQRAATRLHSWVDDDGMWNLRGRFDPLTGVALSSKLAAAVESLFVESVPSGCPTDPIDKQRFLAAHALARVVDGATPAARRGRGEFLVVVDADAVERTGPVAEFSIPVEVPARVIAELAGDAETHTVVVRNGIILHAPGELNLGRTTRLANRAQRRALRGLYATCAIPGCHTHYDRCKLHHIIWWRHGGRTDLDNLVPVCSHHHHKIHDDGWIIQLGPHRELTLRLPDGAISTTGPPTIRAA